MTTTVLDSQTEFINTTLPLKGTVWRGTVTLLALKAVLKQRITLTFLDRETLQPNAYYINITRQNKSGYSRQDRKFEAKNELMAGIQDVCGVIQACQLKTEENPGHSAFVRLKLQPDGTFEYRQLVSIENAPSVAVGGIISQCQGFKSLPPSWCQSLDLKGSRWQGKAKVLRAKTEENPTGTLIQKACLKFLQRKTLVPYGYYVNIHWQLFYPNGCFKEEGLDELAGFLDFDGVIRLAELGNNHSSLCNLRLLPDGNLEYRFLESADTESGVSQAIGGTLQRCDSKSIIKDKIKSCLQVLRLKGTTWLTKNAVVLTTDFPTTQTGSMDILCSDKDCPEAYRIFRQWESPTPDGPVSGTTDILGFLDSDCVIRGAEVNPGHTSFISLRRLPNGLAEYILLESADDAVSVAVWNLYGQIA